MSFCAAAAALPNRAAAAPRLLQVHSAPPGPDPGPDGPWPRVAPRGPARGPACPHAAQMTFSGPLAALGGPWRPLPRPAGRPSGSSPLRSPYAALRAAKKEQHTTCVRGGRTVASSAAGEIETFGLLARLQCVCLVSVRPDRSPSAPTPKSSLVDIPGEGVQEGPNFFSSHGRDSLLATVSVVV